MNTKYHIHMTKFEDIKGGSQYSGWTTLSSGDATVVTEHTKNVQRSCDYK